MEKSNIKDLPFEQYIKEGKMVRIFTPDVPVDELKWHQDLKDRKVLVVEGGKWQFQMDNDLPIILKENQELFIPKYTWHRVIKGTGNLIVEIEEF